MEMLAKHEDTIFLGQAVEYQGTAMYNTLRNVDIHKRLEMPVCEVMQMGMSIGMGINGKVPVSIFPRWNFLLLATDQIVNHLDKYPYMGYDPRVIIRTGIGSTNPLDPQHQHKYDFTECFKSILHHVNVVRLDSAKDIVPAYKEALTREKNRATILVEISDKYNE